MTPSLVAPPRAVSAHMLDGGEGRGRGMGRGGEGRGGEGGRMRVMACTKQ